MDKLEIDYARNFRVGREDGHLRFLASAQLGLSVIRYGTHLSGWAKPAETVYSSTSLEPAMWECLAQN